MGFSEKTLEKPVCYHCGESCSDKHIHTAEKVFCCEGCKMVYGIINEHDLCDYYQLSENPGVKMKVKVRPEKFAFLDNETIASGLIHFRLEEQAHVTFYLPQMHCSSCIWLLEHLAKLNSGIISSTVNFPKREVTIVYDTNKVKLKQLATLLTAVGYEPHISLHDMNGGNVKKYDRSRIYKIGIAGFCFGNIMLLSFPEYFSSGDLQEPYLKTVFNVINVGLSLPVFFYCASEFFSSAFKSLKQRFLNIDAPIALAILITFSRSLYDIFTQSGPGFLDSMSGIVFFMLIGRFFQDKTYQSLTFDRDYTSYFPIGITRLTRNGDEEQIPVSEIRKGDRLLVHSQEIIPADGILFMGTGNIDYSFVTGESLSCEKGIGELVYAGGKQIGAAIEIEVIKEVSQSYLTQLWNNDVFKKTTVEKRKSFVHRVSRYFTYVLSGIAITTALYWLINDPTRVANAVTSVLIVACPCALLLSASFTSGSMMSRLQKGGFFIKNTNVLEGLAEADTIVFDKTGTISLQTEAEIKFEGGILSDYEKQLIRSAAKHSTHPLSRAITNHLPVQSPLVVKNFVELKGEGCKAWVNNEIIKIGSEMFVMGFQSRASATGSRVYVSVNGKKPGYFNVCTAYRDGLVGLITGLKKDYQLALLSGDNNSEERLLRKIFGDDARLLFEQSPQQKLDYIRQLQEKGKKVIMIGDGLNDAGAIQQSDAGIVISDDINNFSPGCDAILDGKQFSRLKHLLGYCKKEKSIIYGSFIISILYNVTGLYFAVQGDLSPVIAAILMPLSSVSIVMFTTAFSRWTGKKISK
ncbi:MAG: heavy metal translocating P-type ATPase metal-binding domain-containing protein [Bacteroidota bacterium]